MGKEAVMSDGIIFVGGMLAYVPEFDVNDFDYDARPMYESVRRTIREA